MKLLQWRDSVVPYPEADAERFRTAGFWGDLTIAGEFHQVALRTPDAVALIGPDRCYTYAELDRETDRIGPACCSWA